VDINPETNFKPENAAPLREETQQMEQQAVNEINVQGDLHMFRSAAVVVHAEKDVQLVDSGAAAIVAGDDISITNGGAQVMVVGRDLEMQTSGAGLIISGRNVSADRSFLGVIISSDVTLGEGTQVLLNTAQAAVFGAALGVAFGLINLLFNGRNRRQNK